MLISNLALWIQFVWVCLCVCVYLRRLLKLDCLLSLWSLQTLTLLTLSYKTFTRPFEYIHPVIWARAYSLKQSDCKLNLITIYCSHSVYNIFGLLLSRIRVAQSFLLYCENIYLCTTTKKDGMYCMVLVGKCISLLSGWLAGWLASECEFILHHSPYIK